MCSSTWPVPPRFVRDGGKHKRLLLATDVWNQVNGVVRTLRTTVDCLTKFGVDVRVLHPGEFGGVRFPPYPEMEVAIPSAGLVHKVVRQFKPHHIHVATEGTVGLSTRGYCVRNGLKFTTSYTTNIPEFGWEMWWIPKFLSHKYVRWFHNPASAVMVSRYSVRDRLRQQGFKNNFAIWSRGADTSLFYPREKKNAWPRPVLLYVGRVSKEKNIDAFLSPHITAGTKVVVGDGPYRNTLMGRYKESGQNIFYTGYLHGEDLAQMYAEADCLVFPSYNDTFGLVMLEALASGTPVATLPIYKDILPSIPGVAGMDHDLRGAVAEVLKRPDADECVEFVRHYYDWEKCSRQFLHNLCPVK